jgi:DsbC/DsbD-like thiol-disulfide interchange protein
VVPLLRLAPALALLACGGEPSPAPTAAAPTTPAPRSAGRPGLVDAALVAEVERITPGERFVVAVALTVAPGYHIYWTNPGDSGLATEVAFGAPPGFAVGPARFPGPHRFVSPGEVESFGWEREVLVSSLVTAPADVGPGRHELTAAVDYVACKEDECVPGKVTATLALPRAAPTDPPPGPLDPRLVAHQAALPRPLAELPGARADFTVVDGVPVLRLELPGAGGAPLPADGTPRYFPSAAEAARVLGQSARHHDRRAVLAVRYRAGPPLTAAGVVAVAEGDGLAYYQLSLSSGGPR